MQPVDPAALSPEGRAVYDKIANSPRGGVRGPFLALLHVPEMCDRLQHLGAYLRYDTTFDARCRKWRSSSWRGGLTASTNGSRTNRTRKKAGSRSR
jgi:hypothetical protein